MLGSELARVLFLEELKQDSLVAVIVDLGLERMEELRALANLDLIAKNVQDAELVTVKGHCESSHLIFVQCV